MRFTVSALLTCVAVVAPAHAKNDQVNRGPAPAWVVESELMPVPANPSGLVFVRRNDTLVHLDRDGQSQYSGTRIKILHPSALQLGNLQIVWNPAAGAPIVHGVKVHRDGKTIDVLESASFDILRREDQLEAARLDGVLTAVLRVSDLRVGDELELNLTNRVRDPALGSNEAGLLVLAPSPPAGRYRLGISWENGHKPNLKMTDDIAAVAKRTEQAVELRFDNPDSMTPPKDAPARYQWKRVVEYSDFPDWASVSRHFRPLFDKAATLDARSTLKEEARRIAAAHSSPFDRASAALKLVQQEVRYVYVGLNGGNFIPATADETWQRRYGDCKGKTALLLALLNELSIEAEPVLANNSGADDGLDGRLPNPGYFDHVLVRARINGTEYWLDGTLPSVAPPSANPVMPYRWALPLSAGGTSIMPLAWRVPERPDEISLHEIDARAGFARPARIISTTIVRGVKGLQQQVELSGLTQAQLLDGFRQQLVGDTWQEIEDVKWRYDTGAQASILTISGTGTVSWEDDGNGARSIALPGGGFNPPERRIRPADQDQKLPYAQETGFKCNVTTVRLPEATQTAHWSFNTQYDTRIFGRNYYRTFELRDGAIRMISGSRVEQNEIDPAAAARDNARIAGFDNSMAWIHYDPNAKRATAGAGQRVPATYEIDWTANAVPCSPSAAGRQTS